MKLNLSQFSFHKTEHSLPEQGRELFFNSISTQTILFSFSSITLGTNRKWTYFCTYTKTNTKSQQHQNNNNMKKIFTSIKHTSVFKRLASFTAAAILMPMALCASEKDVYIPYSMRGSDFNNENSQWCYARSKESEHFIIFWEKGFGNDPSQASAPSGSTADYKVNIDNVLDVADKAFEVNVDKLGFVVKGESKTDTYKMIIRLYYREDWLATGSGEDDMIGILNLSPSAARAGGHTVAHEVGHCFQYQTHCDINDPQRGFNYGFGENGAGGNCWWEQCAQWQGFELFPEEIFTNYRFSEYLSNHHKNIIHESPRYANYFIQWYWTYKHGDDFIGRMWREAKYLEDPVDAYKRMNGLTQEEFNDDMHECNSRLATWDIPSIKGYGQNYMTSRSQCKMNESENEGYYKIVPEMCPENYGYNVIQLNIPQNEKTVKAFFNGIIPDGTTYRRINPFDAEWRYGFVAVDSNGERYYSDMGSAKYRSEKDTLEFTCPENCKSLMLVVTGCTRRHWHHEWDDNNSNDEQWPYEIKLENTDLLGKYNNPDGVPHSTTITTDVFTPVLQGYGYVTVQPDISAACDALCMSIDEIAEKLNNKSIRFAAVQPNGAVNTNTTANGFGHWFAKSGYTCGYSSSAYMFSELREPESLKFYIGQNNPSNCKVGDETTIKQRFTYTKDGKSYDITFVFNIHLTDPTGIEDVESNVSEESKLVASITESMVALTHKCKNVSIYSIDGKLVKKATDTDRIETGNLADGIYMIRADGNTAKFMKR